MLVLDILNVSEWIKGEHHFYFVLNKVSPQQLRTIYSSCFILFAFFIVKFTFAPIGVDLWKIQETVIARHLIWLIIAYFPH